MAAHSLGMMLLGTSRLGSSPSAGRRGELGLRSLPADTPPRSRRASAGEGSGRSFCGVVASDMRPTVDARPQTSQSPRCAGSFGMFSTCLKTFHRNDLRWRIVRPDRIPKKVGGWRAPSPFLRIRNKFPPRISVVLPPPPPSRSGVAAMRSGPPSSPHLVPRHPPFRSRDTDGLVCVPRRAGELPA